MNVSTSLQRQGKRPKVYAKQKGFKNTMTDKATKFKEALSIKFHFDFKSLSFTK